MNLKRRFLSEKDEERCHYDDQNVILKMNKVLKEWVPSQKDIVIVCIGTDRSTGDSLGPLIGTLLKEKHLDNVQVYGTLDEPVHAVNLDDYLELIYKEHKRPFIIGVDACLGKVSSVGQLILGKGPVKPGMAVNKQLPDVGDIHITGVVNVSGFMEYFVLQNTRLNLVMHMAKKVSEVFEVFNHHLSVAPPPSKVGSQVFQNKWNDFTPLKK